MIVAFDFDGTLANSFKLVHTSLLEVIKKYNKNYTEDELNHYFGPSEDGIIYNILGNKNKADFYDYLLAYNKYHNELLPSLNRGALTLLKELKKKGITIVLLTGRTLESTLISLTYFGLNNMFDSIYYGDESGVIKDKNFLKLEKDYNVEAKDIVYIGDSLKDVESCKTANVKLLSINFDSKRYKRIKKINTDTFNNFTSLKKRLYEIIK